MGYISHNHPENLDLYHIFMDSLEDKGVKFCAELYRLQQSRHYLAIKNWLIGSLRGLNDKRRRN